MELIINTHSFVDVITNSSTELFVLDTDKTLEFIKSYIDRLIKDYPMSKNDFHVYTEKENDTYYLYEHELEDYKKALKSNGYKVEKIDNWKPKDIIKISTERGSMHPTIAEKLIHYFNAEIIS